MTGRHRIERTDGVPSPAILERVRNSPAPDLVATVSVYERGRRLGSATGSLAGLTVPVEAGLATGVRVVTEDGIVLYDGPIRAQEYTREGTWSLQGAIVPNESVATPLRGEEHAPGLPAALPGPNHTAHPAQEA